MPRINLFISYAHKDMEYLPEILLYVNEQTCPKIDVWYDEKISPGKEWDDAIQNRLNNADIVLLLLSQSFLMSRYINENELDISLQRHLAGKCRIVPIFLRECTLDRYPDIKKLQGLPRDMSFIAGMGEGKWRHYTEIIQRLNDIADEIDTERNISKSIVNKSDTAKSGNASKIEALRNKRKIFLSTPESAEGRKKRKEFLYQVDGKIKYEKWPYEIVPGFEEAEQLYNKPSKERQDIIQSLIAESLYCIHIIGAEDELNDGIDRMQYELSKQYNETAFFHKNIIWLLNPELKHILTEEMSMNPISTGNDHENIFEIIQNQDLEKEKKLNELKAGFATEKKIFMFYDFAKDHENTLRINLKTFIEENEQFSIRFSLPEENLQKEKEDLAKCEGALIFYGAADPQWFAMRQAVLYDEATILSKAVCVDEPEIERKIVRDISKRAFLVIKGANELETGLRRFLEKLQFKA